MFVRFCPRTWFFEAASPKITPGPKIKPPGAKQIELNLWDRVAPYVFLKKDNTQQIELLNEILKELNEIKFSKKIDELESKLMKDFDEKSYSDLIELKNKINKE